MGGLPRWCPWALAWTAAAILWLDPSSGVSTAILWGAGLHALWNWRRTLAAWRNSVGVLWGLGLAWALLSWAWSFYPAGTARDLVKSAPLVVSVLALPGIFNRSDRIWAALTGSAVLVTVRLGLDLVRIFFWLGWPDALSTARYMHPYVYLHPNVSSMLAGLSALVLVARGAAGAPGAGRKLLLAVGILIDLAFLVVLASRGPQLMLALAALVMPLVLLPGWRTRLVAAVLVLALGAGLWQVMPQINPRFRDRTMVDFNQRNRIWHHARRLAEMKPVEGYGFGKKAFVKALYENPEHRSPRAPFHFPHAHSYWLMLFFQGGAVGFALWSAGWLALVLRLGGWTLRAERLATGWRNRLNVRALPAVLAVGMGFILVYGIGDYPDNVIRHAQFFLAGLAVALTATGTSRGAAVA